MRLLLGIAILVALPGSALAKSVPDAAGLYKIDQMEMYGGLDLRPNGRFLYGLDYGAVSEVSEGRWTYEDGKVILITEPMPPASKCNRGYDLACFDRTTLGAENGSLILYRRDAKIVFKRVQPRPR